MRGITNISFILIDSRLKGVSVNTHDYFLSPRIVLRPIKIVSGGWKPVCTWNVYVYTVITQVDERRSIGSVIDVLEFLFWPPHVICKRVNRLLCDSSSLRSTFGLV